MKYWICGKESHGQRNWPARRLPEIKKTHFKVFHISSLCGGDNGLFVWGHVNQVHCQMIIDTGANVTLILAYKAQEFGEKLIWTRTCVCLQTVIGDKVKVFGKVSVNITFGNTAYHHLAYEADIIGEFILRLVFLRENNFKLDFEKNEFYSNSKDVALFNIKISEIKPIYQIKTKSDVTIPARIETIIPEMLTENNKIHFAITEYPDEENSLKGMLILSSFVVLCRNVIPVRVTNVNEKVKGYQEKRGGCDLHSCNVCKSK